MARIEVPMPQMGESIAEGTVSKWLKQLGETVERDEPILEISTDKVGCRQIFVTCDCHKRDTLFPAMLAYRAVGPGAQKPGHVFYKPGFSGSRRPLQQYRNTLTVG